MVFLDRDEEIFEDKGSEKDKKEGRAYPKPEEKNTKEKMLELGFYPVGNSCIYLK
ncbi:MAG TPA: hypothetical protein VJB11_03775 [archaeon]|nr:hypothetical protein [archaeon]